MNTITYYLSLYVEVEGRTVRQHDFVQRAQLPRTPLIDEAVVFAADHWKDDEEIDCLVTNVVTDMKRRELRIELQGLQISEEDEQEWFRDIISCKFGLLKTLEFSDTEAAAEPEDEEEGEKPEGEESTPTAPTTGKS